MCVQVELLGHVSDAFLWTVANKCGLFSTAAAPVAVNPSADEPEGGRGPAPAGPHGIAAHHAWLLVLLKVWQVHAFTDRWTYMNISALNGRTTERAGAHQDADEPASSSCRWALMHRADQTSRSNDASCCLMLTRFLALATQVISRFQVEQYGHSVRASAVAAVLERTVQQTLATPGGLSGHPAACGARFRLLLLALSLAT